MIRAPKGVRALFSDVNKVGKRIKASKKKFTWKFSVDSREHTIDMYVSTLTGKRKVLVDGDLVYSGKSQSGVYFHYPLKIDRVMVAIEQLEDSWDLKIGGVSFSLLSAMRQSAAEPKDAEWTATQEWKSDKESEFGPVHNKWDDWDKPQAKAEEPRAGRPDPRDQEAWEESRDRRPEEREIRTKPAARHVEEEYEWDTKGFPKEEEYAGRYERRGERPQRREPEREEYYRRDDEGYRREDEYRPRPRNEELRTRPRDEEPKARPRDEDWRRQEEERYREERYPARRPSPGREQDYRSRPADPPKKPQRFEEYERPKQAEFDPFEIHDTPSQPSRAYREEEEDLYPSLSSLDAKRQSQQPAYQPPPVDDPFSAPVNFTPAAANVFSPQQPLPQTPADFKVASSKPFEDDPFLAPAQPPPRKGDADIANLVDLDGLNLGDEYSPAVARKWEEQNRVVSIGVTTPNVPMNQLKPTGPPNAPNPMMTAPMMGAPMVPNPMAAAMMMQSYMTGMMMNSMMMSQGGVPQPRYF